MGLLRYCVCACVCVGGGLREKNGMQNEIMAERKVELSKLEREKNKRYDRMPLSSQPLWAKL